MARGRSAQECFQGLREACGDAALPYRTVARWVKAFREGLVAPVPKGRRKTRTAGTSTILTRYDPCDYDLFTKVKEPLRGTRYNTGDELIRALGRSIRNINKDGRADGVRHLPNIWQKSKQASLVYRSSTRVCVRICVSIRRPEFECSGPQLGTFRVVDRSWRDPNASLEDLLYTVKHQVLLTTCDYLFFFSVIETLEPSSFYTLTIYTFTLDFEPRQQLCNIACSSALERL
ncbi:hypothetical protein ANN_02098 [Periplaneta americana]|uniref:Mos1 transposase HTH domain-containing protein n=1 Tax=Periplaneta americana TaxID=6978 RepID=A0ABQ8TVG6_PERAM|nr:hypothetical protein ANN_02098 [Periplaneta americana]